MPGISLPPVVVESIAGAVGAIVAISATYPLITVNTRQQTTQKQIQPAGDKLAVKSTGWTTVLEILEEDGVPGLFRGWGAAVGATGVSQLVYFYFYALMRDTLVKTRNSGLRAGEKGNISALEALATASLAGAINVVVTSPIWVVTSQIMAMRKSSTTALEPANNNNNNNDRAHEAAGSISDPTVPGSPVKSNAPLAVMMRVVHDTYSEKGVMGFWKGVLPSLMMVSNPAIQYMIYEWLSTQRSRLERNRRVASAGQVFLMGALAKTGATLLTYPMLLVKSRLQCESKHMTYKYNGTLDAITRIAKTEGVGAFYEGMQTKILQSVFGAALMFTLKEEIDRGVTALLLSSAVKSKRVN